MKSQQVIINDQGVFGVHDKSSIVFSNNNGTPHRGGTCSGDSGGPFFRNNTNLQVAVNSYGVPPNCTGGDGAYRIDQPDDVAWLQTGACRHRSAVRRLTVRSRAGGPHPGRERASFVRAAHDSGESGRPVGCATPGAESAIRTLP